MRLPLAIGAVVLGAPSTFQTPLSGQISPVRALVPIGTRFAAVIFMSLPFAFAGRPVEVRYNWSDGRWPSVNLLHSLDGRESSADHQMHAIHRQVAGPNLAALEGFDWDATPVQR
jgi:hypothetical protein